MIWHLMKMVWNRKRWNALILVEILLSVLVVFAVAVMAITLLRHARAPLGFDYADVWYVQLGYPPSEAGPDEPDPNLVGLREMLTYLDNREEVTGYGMINTPPYLSWNWSNTFEKAGRKIRLNLSLVTPGLKDALDLNLRAGRWLDDRDVGREGVVSMVVNQRLAEALFSGEDPIGARYRDEDDDGDVTVFEVVGVIDHFRKEGELAEPRNFAFLALDLNGEPDWLPSFLIVEVAPGVGGAFEEALYGDLMRIAPAWSVVIGSARERRDIYIAGKTAKLKVAGLVGFFMLVMVVMGLVGVLWQHVTRRTVEMGVRRAKGATKRRIFSQITGELLLVATVALALGLIAVVQIPPPRFLGRMPGATVTMAFATTCAVIYALTVLATWYPGWLAMRVSPAEALHYE